MPIIKSNQADRLLKDAIVLDLGDIAKQAARIREDAEARAKQVVTEAEQRAADIIAQAQASGEKLGHAEGFEQGHKQGMEQGLADGREQGLAPFEPIRKTWLEAAEQWNAHRIEIDQVGREAVLDLTLQVVERVLHRVLEVDPTVVADQLSEALSLVLRAGDVTVRISPADRPMVEECLPRLLDDMSHLKHVHVLEDDTLSRGGCLVTYGQGQIDARMETLIQRIVDAIQPPPSDERESAQTVDPPPTADGPTAVEPGTADNAPTENERPPATDAQTVRPDVNDDQANAGDTPQP